MAVSELWLKSGAQNRGTFCVREIPIFDFVLSNCTLGLTFTEILPCMSGLNLLCSIVADASKFEVEFKSDVHAEPNSTPYADMIYNYGDKLIDMQVGQTDMKVRHIFKKFGEVWILDLAIINIFFDKNLEHNYNTAWCLLRQQTTTWKSMAQTCLTFGTSECRICLRFPCQIHCSWISKFKYLLR